jgi:hypothetical protein
VGLFCQFTRGRYDQAANLTTGAREQALQYGQHKSCGFASPSLGKTHDVLTFKNRRDRLDLNRGRGYIAERPEAGRYLRVKLERIKTH